MNCSLCGIPVEGMGHNPEPLAEYEERCCTSCNYLKVIPARLQVFKTIERELMGESTPN